MAIKKRLWLFLLMAVLCVGMFSPTASVYAEENDEAQGVTDAEITTEITELEQTEPEQAGQETTESEKQELTEPESTEQESTEQESTEQELTESESTEVESTETQEKEEEKSSDALTPEGNLTLVDDVGSASGNGKQFVTLVTKSGNYFYLVIDRDDKGNQTVHFLNQVDEEDLFSLMDEEDAKKVQTELAEKEEQVQAEQKVEEKEPEIEKEDVKNTKNIIPTVVALLVLAGGGAVFLFTKFQEKKKERQAAKPDPDENYTDEMDYEFIDENELEDGESETKND